MLTPPWPRLLPFLARPPLKRMQSSTDLTIAPYIGLGTLGRSPQCMCLGRRFNFTTAHPHCNKPTGQPTNAISDREWILRTGRTVDMLLATLPNFFVNGLTTQIIHPQSLLPPASLTGTNLNADRITCTEKDQDIPVYSPSIYLQYTHPTALLVPLPQNLQVKGLPLYIASAMFVRHTINAIYTNLSIKLCMIRRSSPPHMPLQSHPRELRVSIRLLVFGHARLTGQPAEWRVHSTYSFEPTNALIGYHRIDSILPEPHDGTLDLLRRALGETSASIVRECIPPPIQQCNAKGD